MFHPIGRAPAGHDETGGKPVPMGQRLAIHFIGDEHSVIARFVKRQRLHKIRCLDERRLIGALEDDLNRLGFDAHEIEHVLEARTLPAGTAHAAKAPLDARNMRLEKAAAVPRALTDSDNLLRRQFFEDLEIDLRLTLGALPAKGEFPVSRFDFRDLGKMIAHKKGIVRRERRLQKGDWRFVIGRTMGEPDERFLAGERIKNRLRARAFGQLWRKIEERLVLATPGGCGTKADGTAACEKGSGAGPDQSASRQHDPSQVIPQKSQACPSAKIGNFGPTSMGEAAATDPCWTIVAAFYYKARHAGDASGGAQVAQLVEHATENRSVGGSIPPLGTIFVYTTPPTNPSRRFDLAPLRRTIFVCATHEQVLVVGPRRPTRSAPLVRAIGARSSKQEFCGIAPRRIGRNARGTFLQT
jgi:hypothetical protein